MSYDVALLGYSAIAGQKYVCSVAQRRMRHCCSEALRAVKSDFPVASCLTVAWTPMARDKFYGGHWPEQGMQRDIKAVGGGHDTSSHSILTELL